MLIAKQYLTLENTKYLDFIQKDEEYFEDYFIDDYYITVKIFFNRIFSISIVVEHFINDNDSIIDYVILDKTDIGNEITVRCISTILVSYDIFDFDENSDFDCFSFVLNDKLFDYETPLMNLSGVLNKMKESTVLNRYLKLKSLNNIY